MSRTRIHKPKERVFTPLPGPPAKALLSRLASHTSRRPLDLYRVFLSDCMTANHTPNAVSVLEEDLALRFFGDPGAEPRYCSIEKANDLSYLRLASGVTFVVYQRHARFKLLRIFDNRVQLSASYGGHQPSPALVFFLQDSGDGLKLYEVSTGESHFHPFELRDLALRLAPEGSSPAPVGDCLLRALALVLGVELRPGLGRWTFQDVLERPDEVWRALGVPFVLAGPAPARRRRSCGASNPAAWRWWS